MKQARRIAIATCVAWLGLAVHAAPRESNPPPATHAAFEASLKEYVALHRKLEATLPKLPKEATPQQIDHNQRALGTLIQTARKNAKQGEFFTPAMQSYLDREFDRIFVGTEGKNLLGTIKDENTELPKLTVNERYPDAVPLSTMPPQVLSLLPKLEEDMEYRFVGRRLVLYDAHGHLIIDFTDELLPG